MAATPATLPVLKSIEDFLKGSYDYIIVGGGNAGLTLAGRLSEDSSISVAVIEAGGAKIGDPQVLTPAAFPSLFGKPEYDWDFTTLPQQAGTNGTKHAWARGKLLGGTSAINYMMYARGQIEEFNDWNRIAGVKNWGWDGIKPYFSKCESFDKRIHPDDKDSKDYSHLEEHHNYDGPIKTSYASFRSSSERAYHAAAINNGFKVPVDAWSGVNHGIGANLSTIDRSGPGTRSYAVTGYLVPNGQRPNLSVLTDAHVEKVIFEKGTDGLVAKGVAFSHGGKSYKILHKGATILSAGAVMTPQILELSGIGSKSVLEKAGVECLIDNPRVGDVEDHIMSGITYNLVDGEFSLDHVNTPEVFTEVAKQYAAGKGGPLAHGVSNSGFLSLFDVSTEEERKNIYELVEAHKKTLTNDFDRQREDILLSRLKDPKAAILQFISLNVNIDFGARHDMRIFLGQSTGTTRWSTCVGLHHCFSRGSIHITSSDPKQPPAIDAAILDHPVDELLMAFGVRIIDKILNTSPMKEKLKSRVRPTPDVDLSDTEQAVKYIKGHTGTEFHPIAGASLGLVVDEQLNVKGVKGLKVCDSSIIPLHISGNTQGICYAMGEKAADMIKEDIRAAAATKKLGELSV
ncbi:Dehydrogenase [Lachnellula willkommii]|uniref:Dehydrogenase n=1 Tax=Lachnellula willkommii TaxID=215461 RepID=A0A559MEK5_9HELO|nr:Dehydrogenase [Lachnellula willkommii]